MRLRILVTGGAGFIGSNVAHACVSEGHEVVVMDDLSAGKEANLPSEAAFHRVSINSPESTRLIAHGDFDVVLHFAAQVDVRRSVADPVLDSRINVIGSLNVLEAVRRAGSSTRVVFASTGGAIYGALSEPPNCETDPKNPDSPYGVSKLAVELMLAYYTRIHHVDCVALRFGNVYGPRQDPHGEAGVVAIFCGKLLENSPLTIYGDGKQTRDYVYVSDLSEAVLHAMRMPFPNEAGVDSRSVNIGTGSGTSVLTLAEQLIQVSGVTVPIQHGVERRGEQRHSVLEVQKAKQILDWTAKTTLDVGLSQTFAWFKNRAGELSLSASGVIEGSAGDRRSFRSPVR